MIELDKPQRIIFQPTKKNSDKIKRLAHQNNMSVSTLLNHILDEVNDNASMSFGNLATSNIVDIIANFDRFKSLWEDMKTSIENNPIKPFSELRCTDENYRDIICYDDKTSLKIEVKEEYEDFSRRVIIHPIVLDKLVDDGNHHDIMSEWNDVKGVTFGIEVCKDSAGQICSYNIYAVFEGKPIYRLIPVWSDEDVEEKSTKKGQKNFDCTYINIFEEDYYWAEEFLD